MMQKSNELTEGGRAGEGMLAPAFGAGAELFQRIFDSSRVAVVISRLADGLFVEANPEFLRLCGYARQELIGRTSVELGILGQRDREALREALPGEGTLVERELKLTARDGSPRWVLATAQHIDLGGEACIFWSGFDVSERKRAEAREAESERSLREAQRVARLGSWEWDAGVDRVTWSRQMYRFFGLDEGLPVPGYTELARFYTPESWSRLDAAVQEALRSGRSYELDLETIRVDGSRLWVTARGEAVRDEAGKVTGLRGTALDITERKRVEQALRDSEQRLALALEAGQAGSWDWEMGSNRLTWSTELFNIFGLAVCPEPTFELWRSAVHPDDREVAEERILSAVQKRVPLESEYRVVHPDGQVRWVRALGRAVYNAEGKPTHMAGICLDVTVRRVFEEELERIVAERTARLHELVGELEHFSYSITHDLKAPLRAMKGFAELASMLCEQGEPAKACEFLARISSSAERMSHLITDALHYNRAVRQELPLEEVEVAPLLHGILESYPELQPDKAHIQVEGTLPAVLANQAGLTQCLANLLENAVKFAKPGTRPEIRVRAVRQEHWVRIWVEDQGIGISAAMLPRVFDMFSRGSRDYPGTGIGLALVRKAVQRMGGRVGVESTEGQGSRFWIELQGIMPDSHPGSASDAAAAEPARKGVVLYVEDEENDVLFMEHAFAARGCAGQLRLAADGRAAMDYMSGAGKYHDRETYPVPGLVLLDLNLPHIPGFEVLKWMRNHPDYARTPVVVFSSSTREEDRARARELGANEFISKPASGLNFGEVVDALRTRWHF